MEKYGFKGIVFPVANYIGLTNKWDVTFFDINKKSHLTKKQIILLANSGWEVGSHGLTHTPFTMLSESDLINEAISSKNILENIIKKKVISITPPFCKWDTRVLQLLVDVGYENIYYQPGLNNPKNKHLIPRRSIYSIDTKSSIKRKYKNYKSELFKELIIHKFSNLTILVKDLL